MSLSACTLFVAFLSCFSVFLCLSLCLSAIQFSCFAPISVTPHVSPAPRYPANIEKIDYSDEKILIHYRQWSHRYDEWFDWTSPYLRPVERIQLRRQGLLDDCPIPVRDVLYLLTYSPYYIPTDCSTSLYLAFCLLRLLLFDVISSG